MAYKAASAHERQALRAKAFWEDAAATALLKQLLLPIVVMKIPQGRLQRMDGLPV